MRYLQCFVKKTKSNLTKSNKSSKRRKRKSHFHRSGKYSIPNRNYRMENGSHYLCNDSNGVYLKSLRNDNNNNIHGTNIKTKNWQNYIEMMPSSHMDNGHINLGYTFGQNNSNHQNYSVINEQFDQLGRLNINYENELAKYRWFGNGYSDTNLMKKKRRKVVFLHIHILIDYYYLIRNSLQRYFSRFYYYKNIRYSYGRYIQWLDY